MLTISSSVQTLRAFASYIQKAGGCNAIQEIQCDAVNMEALKAYEKNLSDDKIKDAYDCLYERCLVSSEQ